MNDQEKYDLARKRVDAKIGFYCHFAAYIAVNVLLIIINLCTTPNCLWFQWPLAGWGMGVIFHALGAFAFADSSPIKQQMIEKEMQKKE